MRNMIILLAAMGCKDNNDDSGGIGEVTSNVSLVTVRLESDYIGTLAVGARPMVTGCENRAPDTASSRDVICYDLMTWNPTMGGVSFFTRNGDLCQLDMSASGSCGLNLATVQSPSYQHYDYFIVSWLE